MRGRKGPWEQLACTKARQGATEDVTAGGNVGGWTSVPGQDRTRNSGTQGCPFEPMAWAFGEDASMFIEMTK